MWKSWSTIVLATIFLATFTNLIGGAAAASTPRRQKSYDGYQVFRVFPDSADQLQFLEFLYVNDSQMALDFWNTPTKTRQGVDIMVPPQSQKILKRELSSKSMQFEVRMDNVQDAINRETESVKYRQSLRRDDPGPSIDIQQDSPGFSSESSSLLNIRAYHSYSEIQQYMSQLEQTYPGFVQKQRIGTTFEGRPIEMVKIGNIARASPSRPGFWLDAGIHAREWIAPAVALYVINQLITGYGRDQQITSYVDQMDWFILPVVNPDGYEFSRNSDRMWRKNRNPNGAQQFNWCTGVDLNRNFDFEFGGKGSSYDPCKEIYHGTEAFSEPESRAIRDAVQNIGSRLQGFVTLHSYSQIWMYPYGDERNHLAHDWQELRDVALRGARRLKSFYGTDYVVDTGANALYPAAGGSDDWAKGKAGIKFVYLIELRPDDNSANSVHGFLLPESQIVPTARETWAGFQVIADEILTRSGVQPVAITATLPTAKRSCQDQRTDCAAWQRMRLCGWVRDSCEATCNFCGASA